MRRAPRGSVRFDGIDILGATEDQMCALRGDDIGMVFQEPMTALNPVKTIGEQVAEGIRWHTGANRRDAEDRARKMLDRVGLPEAKFPLSRYPHELSGGQRQRVVIAIACALKPKLLIADEPTTALDVVLQQQILELLRDLVDENRMGLLLISHDLAVVADMADRITILRGGAGDGGRRDGKDAVGSRSHPYTRQLAQASMHVPARARHRAQHAAGAAARRSTTCRASIPAGGCRCSGRAGRSMRSTTSPSRSDPASRPRWSAVPAAASRRWRAWSWRSTGRHRAAIRFLGETLTGKEGSRTARRAAQHAGGLPGPLRLVQPAPQGRAAGRRAAASARHASPMPAERRELVLAALHEVGLKPEDIDKYPHEFSGGQRQRLSIARALITRPKLIVADEPVSALDVSIRAQILDLFADLNGRLGVAYLFITHDLTVARAITDDVMVMDEGRIVETGKTAEVLDHPQSDAARALVAAAPDLHRAIARRFQEQG